MSIAQFSSNKTGGKHLEHSDTVIVSNAAAGNAAADVITEDAIIHTILIQNENEDAQPKITCQDRAAVPRKFGFGKNTIVGGGGSIMFESENGAPVTNGLNISCDTLNGCSVKIVWRKP